MYTHSCFIPLAVYIYKVHYAVCGLTGYILVETAIWRRIVEDTNMNKPLHHNKGTYSAAAMGFKCQAVISQVLLEQI